MCTVILLHRASRLHPLIVAANRDELHARPASAPLRIAEPGAPVIACGLDRERGGTWMGVNQLGLFVGITNQRGIQPPKRALRSRGHVVIEALRRRDIAAVRSQLEGLDPREYGGFNLVYGDGRRLEIAYARPERRAVDFDVVPEGVHVLPNDTLDAPGFPKVARALELVGSVDDLEWNPLAERLAATLSDHRLPESEQIAEASGRFDPEVLRALQALCVHLPSYGTRSATIAAIEPGRVAHYLFAAGPSCTTPFVEHRDLLRTKNGW